MANIVKGVPFPLLSNQRLPAAPPSYFLPNASVYPIPSGCLAWELTIDQTNVPDGATYAFAVQYQRLAAWTDKAGGAHPAGEWLDDVPMTTFVGGTNRNGSRTNFVGSEIGSRDSQGNMVEPYPDNVRVVVGSMNATWVWPSITITLT